MKNIIKNLKARIFCAAESSEAVSSSIYHELAAFIDKHPGFVITKSFSSDIEDMTGKRGEYNIITGFQGKSTDCGAQSVLNYLYTLDKTFGTDYAGAGGFDKELNIMHELMGWTPAGSKILGQTFYGILPGNMKRGAGKYTKGRLKLKDAGRRPGLKIGLYANLNVVDTAHYALVVGSGRLKTQLGLNKTYDIITTWNKNFEENGGKMTRIEGYRRNYHVVDHSFAIKYFEFAENKV